MKQVWSTQMIAKRLPEYDSWVCNYLHEIEEAGCSFMHETAIGAEAATATAVKGVTTVTAAATAVTVAAVALKAVTAVIAAVTFDSFRWSTRVEYSGDLWIHQNSPQHHCSVSPILCRWSIMQIITWMRSAQVSVSVCCKKQPPTIHLSPFLCVTSWCYPIYFSLTDAATLTR